MSAFPDVLIETAQFERDRRAERYPALVQDGKLGEDEATLDWQCWHVIAAWFETGTFTPIYEGGADERTAVDWALAEDAAAKALAKVKAKASSLAESDPAFAETHRRRAKPRLHPPRRPAPPPVDRQHQLQVP